ncbi:MAG: hypothetical protein QXI32_01275 [Candidatus Bathyarchaeia archaeon]
MQVVDWHRVQRSHLGPEVLPQAVRSYWIVGSTAAAADQTSLRVEAVDYVVDVPRCHGLDLVRVCVSDQRALIGDLFGSKPANPPPPKIQIRLQALDGLSAYERVVVAVLTLRNLNLR